MRLLLSNTGLLLISILVCLVTAEIFVRIVIPEHKQTESRTWMLSSETFRLDDHGAVRYLPNQQIRSVEVSNGEIVEDVEFHTNNLGLIDFADYKNESVPGKRYYAFVGDSFTAGFHGGEAWVPKLRTDLNSEKIYIYNLGVSGTGFEQFQRLVSSVATQLTITDIVILAISDDIFRTFWYPLTSPSEVRFCPKSMTEQACLARPPLAIVVDHDLTQQEIFRTAAESAPPADQPPTEEIATEQRDLKHYLKQSRFLVLVNKTIRELTQVDINKDIARSLESVKKIQDEFPQAQMHLVHLPVEQEVANGSYYVRNLGDEVTKLGIEYFPALTECNWSVQMYSGHPNQSGYQNIADCVSSHLFTDRKASTGAD